MGFNVERFMINWSSTPVHTKLLNLVINEMVDLHRRETSLYNNKTDANVAMIYTVPYELHSANPHNILSQFVNSKTHFIAETIYVETI